MSRDENIIRTYRDGSAEVRMDIYLAHPGLRGRFDEIEREEERGSPLTSPPTPGRSKRSSRTSNGAGRPL